MRSEKKPLVSVIVPLYNRRHLISRCAESVMRQTFADWELIIVDDGSTDAPQEVLAGLQQRDARIRVLQRENSGVSGARNAGLEHARGDFIQFLDSDDELVPETLEMSLQAIRRSGADAVAFPWLQNVNAGGSCAQPAQAVYEGAESYIETLLHRGELCVPWNKLWKRSLIGETRFCPGISWGEDFIFNLTVLERCRVGCRLARPLYSVHEDAPTSLSRSYAPSGFDDMLAQGRVIDSFLKNCTSASLRKLLLSYIWACYMQCVRKLCVCSGLPYLSIVAQLRAWNTHPRMEQLKGQYAAYNKTWVSRLLRRGIVSPVPLVQRLVVRKSRMADALRAMKKRLHLKKAGIHK